MSIYWMITGVLTVAYLILMIVYMAGYATLPYWKADRRAADGPPLFLSVIIPARNEAAHIEALIRSIVANDYPAARYEILLVDDFSEDHTAVLAEKWLPEGSRVLRLQEYLSPEERLNAYKKKALEIAIGAAKGDVIITTDADCTVPAQWLRLINEAYQDARVQLVAAPVAFVPATGHEDALFWFQSLDFMTMQGITMSAARLNLGNMCNGANLSFRKKAFETVNGYKGIDDIASGDDMLLMYKIRERFPDGIRYLKSTDAIVSTAAQPTWKDFLNQRIRWSSKADRYDDKKLIWILLLVYLFNLNMLILFVVGLFHTHTLYFFLFILFCKTVAELIFLFPVSRFFRKEKELIYFPFLEPLHIIYIIMAGFLGKFGHYRWKGRTVK